MKVISIYLTSYQLPNQQILLTLGSVSLVISIMLQLLSLNESSATVLSWSFELEGTFLSSDNQTWDLSCVFCVLLYNAENQSI